MADNNPKELYNGVKSYHNLIILKMIIAEAFSLCESKSGIVENIIRDHYNKIPDLQRDRLLRIYEKMTPEQRMNPRQLKTRE